MSSSMVEPKLIVLKNSEEYALVDEQDYREVVKYDWLINTKFRYALTYQQNKPIYLNRFVYKLACGDTANNRQLTYINGDTLDCRRSNICLRNQKIVSMRLDQPREIDPKKLIKSSQNKTGYMGVRFNKLNKNWEARINKDHYIGGFETKELAAFAYLKGLQINSNQPNSD